MVQADDAARSAARLRAHLLIMKLIRFTFFRSSGSASGFGFPRYVGLNSPNGITNRVEPAAVLPSPPAPTTKSYSQLTVLWSRPSGRRGSTSSLRVSVYLRESARATSSTSASYAETSHPATPSAVRCEANPAPPRAVMSRWPENSACEARAAGRTVR